MRAMLHANHRRCRGCPTELAELIDLRISNRSVKKKRREGIAGTEGVDERFSKSRCAACDGRINSVGRNRTCGSAGDDDRRGSTSHQPAGEPESILRLHGDSQGPEEGRRLNFVANENIKAIKEGGVSVR